MKIGVTCALKSPRNFPIPLVNPDIFESIDYLAEKGFDAIELHLLRSDEVDGEHISSYCSSRGIFVSSIGTGMAYVKEGLSLTSADKSTRDQAVGRIKEHLDLASILGCSVIIGSIRGCISLYESYNKVNCRFLDVCSELCEYAEKGNGSLVIEAINRYETNYLNSATEVMKVIKQVKSKKLGVHLDTYHMNLEEKDWQSPVYLCGEHLLHIHIVDNTRRYPGAGLIDFELFLQALKKIGYSHALTMECVPWPDGRKAVERGLAFLRDQE